MSPVKFFISLLFSVLIVSCGTGERSDATFRITAIPDEAPTELLMKAEPLIEHLEKQTGLDIEFIPVTDYAAAVEALVNRKVDMAWYGGFTFVQAKIRSNDKVIPIIQRAEDEKFQSVFITSDSTIKGLEDLKGVTFSFGSQSSTSGHLMPRTFLANAGIIPEENFKRTAYSGAHDATVASVGSGKVQAGALNIKVWEKLSQEGKVPEGTRVFYTTPYYYDYNWTVHQEIPEVTRKKIANAFLMLTEETDVGKRILELQRASRFIPTNAENYEDIEKAARNAGLLK
tara:strand:+ start:4397 stop:5254 length:858 start_codon:yes stop_codon:yes gene_type:complete